MQFDMRKNVNLLVVEHCNNTCVHCSTGSPFAKRAFHPAESFIKWLDVLERAQIAFEYISLTGGEPFLHPQVLDGSFIRQLRDRYPSKRVGATTNFFWASEERIKKYAPVVDLMNGGLDISLYANIVARLGGSERARGLIDLLKRECPNAYINAIECREFIRWEFHEDRREVGGPCVTSDCFILRPDGKVSHCSLAIGGGNRSGYAPIVERSREAFFDLARGVEGYAAWASKYPFDLCAHCTMWQHGSEPMRFDVSRDDARIQEVPGGRD
jgi:hypothetical protein